MPQLGVGNHLADGSAVVPQPYESIDTCLRRFKKAVNKANIIHDWRRHEYFTPPSQRRRMKRAQARKRRGDTSGVV